MKSFKDEVPPTSIVLCRSFIKYDRELFKKLIYRNIPVNYVNESLMQGRIFMQLELINKTNEKNNSNAVTDYRQREWSNTI